MNHSPFENRVCFDANTETSYSVPLQGRRRNCGPAMDGACTHADHGLHLDVRSLPLQRRRLQQAHDARCVGC